MADRSVVAVKGCEDRQGAWRREHRDPARLRQKDEKVLVTSSPFVDVCVPRSPPPPLRTAASSTRASQGRHHQARHRHGPGFFAQAGVGIPVTGTYHHRTPCCAICARHLQHLRRRFKVSTINVAHGRIASFFSSHPPKASRIKFRRIRSRRRSRSS